MTDSSHLPKARNWLRPLAAVLIAVIAAAIFVYPRQWTRGFLINDEMYFATLARNISEGSGYVTYAIDPFVADEVEGFPVPELTRPPGYSVVYALVLRLGFEDVAGGVALSVFWLALTMLAFYRLGEHLLGSWKVSTFLCGVYLASYTTLVHATASVPEMQLDALFLLMCWALLDPRPWRCLFAGAALHLALATKMLALPYVPLVPLYLWWGTGSAVTEDDRGQETPEDDREQETRAVVRRWQLPVLGPRSRLLVPLAAGFFASWLVVTVVAAVPGGAQVETTGRYAYNFLMETSEFPAVGSPWHTIEPPSPLSYFTEHPSELVVRTAKLMSRTPTVLNAVGSPPLEGSLAGLLLVTLVLAATMGWPQQDKSARAFLWFSAAAFVVTLPAVWAYLVRMRYFYQLYPLMLLMIAAQAARLRGLWRGFSPAARRAVATVGVLVLVAYPLALNLRLAYRDPYAFVGRTQAVRILDYETLGEDIRSVAPPDGVVVTDFAYEIPWLTGNPAVFPAIKPDEFRWLVDRFEVPVVALRNGSHPGFDEQLRDFELRVERPGYSIFVRRDPD